MNTKNKHVVFLTGAGSAITRNCEDGKLVLARSRQTVIEGWVRPEKGDKK